ncbi:MAG: type II secretion system F family protein [Solirubrobacterales bacterium]
MNALLAGAGTAFGLLAAADLLAAVARPASFGVVAAALRPASAAARRGRDASRSERAGLGALMGLAAFVAFSLAAGLLPGVVAAAAALSAASAVVRARRSRWRRAMREGAAAAARAVGDAANVGLPGVAALERAAADGAVSPQVSIELADLATRCRLGLDLGAGLAELRSRAATPEWDALVSAMIVQRQVGGDLARILGSLAGGLETSARSRAEARSLSSQARLTARIVVGMPLAGLVICELVAPGTLARMLSSPLPRGLTLAAFVLQVAAVFAVRRVARLGEKGT